MKKIIFLLFFIILSTNLKAQYSFSVGTGPGISPVFNYVYVGSLNRADYDSGNSQKLEVEIMGAGWFNDTKGITTFYIANRNGLTVNQVTQGGASFSKDILKAYQNGASTDFYLSINSSADYYSFAINAYTFGFGMPSGPVTITTQTATPTGIDISASLNINPVMITDAGGNIAIGTSDPQGYKLAVNGSMIATSIKVKPQTNWPDYVFKPKYHLPSLTDVKTYIDENRHLPDMPSEQEVAKNGVDLGEMVKLQTKKIEELTLYLLEQNREMKDQKKKQQKRIELLEAEVAQLLKQIKPLKSAIN